jgi:lipocalin
MAHSFDKEKYTGRWYEIARYPFFWEDASRKNVPRCLYATADYEIRDHCIHVTNSCYSSLFDSPISIRTAIATPKNNENTTYRFGDAVFHPMATFFLKFDPTKEDPEASRRKGDYILAYTDYDTFAIVLSSENLAWILVRDLNIESSSLNTILCIAKGFGVELKRLTFTHHRISDPSAFL